MSRPGIEPGPPQARDITFFCGPDREITFENAEELTEEGLPFLILFHNPDDTDSIKVSRLYWYRGSWFFSRLYWFRQPPLLVQRRNGTTAGLGYLEVNVICSCKSPHWAVDKCPHCPSPEVRIPASGSLPKCHGSATLVCLFP
jgi:hypothetical protein